MYYGLHKNYSLVDIITMHKKVKRVCPTLPELILKNETYETLPEEYKSNINQLLNNPPQSVRNFIERFMMHRQKTEKLRNRKFGAPVSSGRKLVPYEEATSKQ
jgi:hypothetical protein